MIGRQMEPLERLLDLLQYLLTRRVAVTFTEIRDNIPDAYGQGNVQTAKRMFERDKDALRESGIPIETRPVDDLGGELGYIIERSAYELPAITFTEDELAAILVATRPTSGDEAAIEAARKLLAGTGSGVLIRDAGDVPPPVDPRSPTVDQAAGAVASRRLVRFSYRTAGGAAGEREVDAWGVVFRAGRWYLVGWDRSRDDVRAFRLQRVEGALADAGEGRPRPADFVAADHVGPEGLDAGRRATVALAPEVIAVASGIADARTVGTGDDDWTVIDIPFDDVSWFASWVLALGDRAVVRGPEDLRAEVVRRLEAVARG